AVFALRGILLLGAQMDRQDVRREAREMALLAVDDLLQRHFLPDALPGPGRHAAQDSGLRAAVRRVQRDRLDRRVRLRAVPDPVPVDRPESNRARARREGGATSLGGRRHARVDASAESRSLSQLRRATGAGMTPEREQRRSNRMTALVLGSIALVFFVAIMLKYAMLK